MKQILGFALTALTAGWLWAEPSIAINRVQQRYPWNGMVDVTYAVSGVANPANCHVRFKINEGGKSLVLHEFLDAKTLVEASNDTHTVTWNSAWEDPQYRFFSRNATITAEIISDGGVKTFMPYGDRYVIVDLSGGPDATNYPVTEERIYGLTAATNKFNRDEYKTTNLVLRLVKSGTFMMGSPVGTTTTPNGARLSAELDSAMGWLEMETQHQVTLTKNFLLGMFEVTQMQYCSVMGGTKPTGDNRFKPKANVSYKNLRGATEGIAVPPTFGRVDAGSFMAKLRDRTGLEFDLPTEAQWEYACRAGTTTATYAGGNTSAELQPIAFFGAGSDATPTVVGRKRPNAWGFYDMLGNVWEICRDRVKEARLTGQDAGPDNFGFGITDTKLPSRTDPVRDEPDMTFCSRGGCAVHGAYATRSAARHGYYHISNTQSSRERNATLGFRISRTLP